MPLTTAEANAILPQAPTRGIIRPERLKYLIIGPPKFGKTTTATMIPNAVLLAFEEGHAFTECFKIIIDQWDRPFAEKQLGVGQDEDGNLHMSLAEAVELICASDRFDHVIFDTADMAARMCVDFWCAKLKVAHPADAGDFGKGFALTLTDPFRRMIGPLIKSGRGMSFTSHSKFVERKTGNVVTSAKWESTLPSQAQAFLHSQVDVIWHGKFGKMRPGQDERDRILSTDASQELMAGSRVRIDNELWPIPKSFILDPVAGWEQWSSFFPKHNPDYNVNAAPDEPESVEWLVTKEQARQNCVDAYNQYQHLVLGRAAIEKEAVVEAAAHGAPMPGADLVPSEAEDDAHKPSGPAEPAEPVSTAHLESPRGLKRIKKTT